MGVSVNRTDKEFWLRDGGITGSYHSAVGLYDPIANRADGGHVGANGDGWLLNNGCDHFPPQARLGEAFWEDVRQGSLPVTLVESTRNRVRARRHV